MKRNNDQAKRILAVACSALMLTLAACSEQEPAPSAAKPTAAATGKKSAVKPAAAPGDSAEPAAAGPAAGNGPGHKYIGVKKCSTCHKGDKKGDQFGHWQKSKHSKAFQTLLTPKAKEAGKKAGVDDPSTDGKCLKCHVTAYDVEAKWIGEGFDPKDGVQCESCHGPGNDYAKKRIMEDETAALGKGLILPDEKVCVKCHNDESPFYKEFHFDKYFEQIRHPRPAK
jgi:hypothetical protein